MPVNKLPEALFSMDTSLVVHLKADFKLERMDDEIVVYHPSITTSLYFNETGALIWELCDGQQTVAEIIAMLAGIYPESAEIIGTEVIDIIAALVRHQVAELR
jgi:hypothetical protein